MGTRRRARPRVSARRWRRGGPRGELFLPLGRQRLILLPLLPYFVLLVGRKLPQRLVALAHGLPLGRRQLRPRAHLRVNPLLLVRRHGGKALRDAAPLLPSLRIEPIPVRLQWRENLPLLRRELIPGRRSQRDLGRRGRRDAGGEHERERQRSESALSQFRNPRSR